MTRCGLGHRVFLMAVWEERAAVSNDPEAASKLRVKAIEIVGAHLIDGDQDDQRRTLDWRRGLTDKARGREDYQWEEQARRAHGTQGVSEVAELS